MNQKGHSRAVSFKIAIAEWLTCFFAIRLFLIIFALS
jgi:hypothetical protein